MHDDDGDDDDDINEMMMMVMMILMISGSNYFWGLLLILFLDDIPGGSLASGLGGVPRLSKIDFHGCLDSFEMLFLLYFKEVWPPSPWTAEWRRIGLQWQDGVPCWGVWNGDF